MILEGLQVLDQRVLVGRREIDAEDVTLVARRPRRSVEARAHRLRLVALGDEAHVHGIVEGVAAPENLWALIGRGEQIAHGGDRAIVKERRAQPQTVEERCVVAHERLLYQTLAL